MTPAPPAAPPAARPPNVRLRANVLCVRLVANGRPPEWSFEWSEREVVDRLFYWDLLELSRAFPDRLPSEWAYESSITRRQLAERHAFLREGLLGARLWPRGFGSYVAFRWPGVKARETSPPEPVPPGDPIPAKADRIEIPVKDIAPRPSQDEEIVGAKEKPVDFEPAVVPAPVPVKVAPPIVAPVVAPPPAPTVTAVTEEPAAHTDPGSPQTAAADGLDDAQREVALAPATARMVVLAPPGTGKTYTLIERVRRLVRSDAASGAAGIIVLSFTRAAVAEIVGRISTAVADGNAGDDLRYVTVRTFDSFATHALIRDASGASIPGGGHEARIREFTRRLEKGELTGPPAEQIAATRCLLVDEVQDLVGVRGRMVRALARAVLANGGGVTVFGDFAQAIYDYQEGPGGFTSAKFLAEIRDTLGTTRLEVTLATDHRSTSECVRQFVRDARAAMGADGTTPSGGQLARLIHDLGAPAAPREIRDGVGRVAVLARTNLQAYHVAEWCRSSGTAVEMVRGSSASYAPAWLARLFAGFPMEVMSLSTARARWDSLIGATGGLTFEDAERRLRAAGVVEGQRIMLPRLNLAVLERRAALVARPVPAGAVAVSTIHRSKGLEFDSVFLLQQDQWQGKPEEVRVVYVAATRARASLRLLAKCDRELGIRPQWHKSAVRYHHHSYDRETKANRLFLEGLDEIDEDSLAESVHTSDAGDAMSRQEALWQARAGEASWCVRWSPDGRYLSLSAGGNDTPVCYVSDPLETDLGGFRRYGLNRAELFGVRVPDLATVAFPPDDADALDAFGYARLALAPVADGWAKVISS